MTTFTLQDLTPEQQDTEALQSMAKLGGGVDVLLDGLVGKTEEARHEAMHAMHTIVHNRAVFDAPTPQPTLCEVTQTPDLESIINTICTQLQLLSTVIKGGAGNSPNTTPPEGNQSLQDTVALTLQQADWFSDLVRHELIGAGIEDIAKEAVEGVVESEVEHYFNYRFDPSEHFDFGDAVSDAVDDRLDDIVREKIDECLEEVVAEKLSEASVSISF